MDITQLSQELRAQKIRPCYLIKGAESYLVRTAREHILRAIFPSAQPEYDAFNAAQGELEKALDSLRTPSMFVPWRVVIVEEAQKLKKEDFDLIAAIFQKGIDQATLILIGEETRSTQHKNFPQLGGIVECKKLYANQIPSWVNMEAKRFGVTISREAAQCLAEALGENLGELVQALEKLTLYVGEKKLIDLKDVEALIADTGQKSIFDLTNAIGEKNSERSSELLEKILVQGEPPVKALTMIARHFRLLAKTQDILRNKATSAELASALKVNPFFVKDYLGQSRKLNPKEWKRRFRDIYQADGALKSSRHKAATILGRLARNLMKD